MATSLSRDQIISHAVQIGGNPSITALASDWLNNIIDTLSQSYRWPELQGRAQGTMTPYIGGDPTSIALPTDFGDLWDVHGIILIDSNGTQISLMPQPLDWFDLLTSRTDRGQPKYVGFDLNSQFWVVYPLPEQTYTWQVRYVIKASRLSSNTTIPFATDQIFIQALYVQILQYEDDARYLNEIAVLQSLIGKYLGQLNSSPLKARAVRFNANVFRTPQAFR